MTTFTTIRDLTQHIEPLLGSEADPAIVERVAYGIWGDAKPGDDIEIPGDLAQLYLEAEAVHAELTGA
jgi:hypothetical protein